MPAASASAYQGLQVHGQEDSSSLGFVLRSWKFLIEMSFAGSLQDTLSNHSSNDYAKTRLTKKLWKQAQEIEVDNEVKAIEGGRDWRNR